MDCLHRFDLCLHKMDMDSVCRVCIEKAVKFTPLGTKIEVSSTLSFLDFLNKCTNLNASESDKLPQSLCSLCASSLKTFYSFVKLAEKSNIILKESWKDLQQQCKEAPVPQNIPCGFIDNNEFPCEEIAIKNEKIEEEFEDFRKENSFHFHTNENLSGSSLYILDIVKEEVCVSDGTSIVDSKDSEIKERQTSKSNLDQPEGHIQESEDILSYKEGSHTSVDANHSDCKNNVPSNLLKRELIKIEDEIDVQSDDDQSHCIPSNVKKKTNETETESEGTIKGEASDPQKTKTEYKNDITIGHAGTNQISSEAKDDSLTPNVPGSTESTSKCIECDFDINDSEDFTTNSREHLVIRKETKKYKCSICGKGFIHLSCRWKHMKLHGKNPYECEICGEKLRNKADHKSHLRVHSNIRFTCPQCGRVYKSKKYLLSHINSHASNQLECQLSNTEITSQQSLNIHIESHITEKCDKCDQEFENLDALSMHMKLHKKKYECEKCSKIFYKKHLLNAHMDKHNGKLKCQQCGKEFKFRYSLCRHMKRHTEPKPFQCQKCGATFRRKHELKVHMEENHSKKCDQCGKEFQHICSLNRHIRRQHTNPKQVEYEICSLCSKQFRSKHTLNIHMENHKGITKKCDQCGKEFRNSDALKRHMKLHTKPFKCEKCGKLFIRKYQFNVHMENHKGVKKKCQQCDKEFKNSNTLKQHMILHTNPLKCEICGKFFTEKYQFNVHMENHKRVKKKCQQCDKEFKNSDHLRRHMEWHVDPKPFKCKNCGKLLSRKHNYVRHMEICQPVDNSFEKAVTMEASSFHSKGNEDISQ